MTACCGSMLATLRPGHLAVKAFFVEVTKSLSDQSIFSSDVMTIGNAAPLLQAVCFHPLHSSTSSTACNAAATIASSACASFISADSCCSSRRKTVSKYWLSRPRPAGNLKHLALLASFPSNTGHTLQTSAK